MKKTLFLAMMTLAALTATAQRNLDDFDDYTIIPSCATEGTVVWDVEDHWDLFHTIIQDNQASSCNLTEESPYNGGLNYFSVEESTGKIKVKEGVTLDYDNLSAKQFGFKIWVHYFDSYGREREGETLIFFTIDKVSMAEGTEDANSWKLGANASVVPPGIKAEYSGKRKIKSVTARKVTTQ